MSVVLTTKPQTRQASGICRIFRHEAELMFAQACARISQSFATNASYSVEALTTAATLFKSGLRGINSLKEQRYLLEGFKSCTHSMRSSESHIKSSELRISTGFAELE